MRKAVRTLFFILWSAGGLASFIGYLLSKDIHLMILGFIFTILLELEKIEVELEGE